MGQRIIKIILFSVLFFLFLLPIYRVALAGETKTNEAGETRSLGYAQIKNIQKIIGEKTPEFISKPIIKFVEVIESFRSKTAGKTENKIITTVFNSKIIFYSFFAIVFFYLFRIIWRLIFKQF